MQKKSKKVVVKQDPDDFFVEELTDLEPGSQGVFSLYRLEKVGWTTMDALQAIRRRWQLDFRRVSYGGLKDRHAHTLQYFSVFRGPQRTLHHQRITVQYLGQIAFRAPVPAYRHDAAMFLRERGQITCDATHPTSPTRPDSDRALLADIARRLDNALRRREP